MGRIILLDEQTASQIAAGEVVERPASVVKELVENAIDAKSGRIEISIIDGGLTEITVSDNGTGMDRPDAELALARHATSKIKNAGDLQRVETLGFRGEALPSIAAVSKLRLKTRAKEAVSGTELVSAGGRILSLRETGCPAGTTVRVNNLFFNTPARYKHLKNPAAEAGQVSELVNKFALGCPQISFRLISNGRVLLNTPGSGDLLACLALIYGTETAREMLTIKARAGDLEISGYLGKPSLTRSSRHHQTIYVNDRYVRSRTISEAVERAYHSLLMTRRHPVFVLKLKTGPEKVDVNVHPAKTEVRLAEAGLVEDFVTKAAAETLAKNRLIPLSIEKPRKPSGRDTEEYRQAEWKISSAVLAAAGRVQEVPAGSDYAAQAEPGIRSIPAVVQPPGAPSEFPELRPLGQIDCTYIVAQGADGMYLIDQHAAHERILYEQYMAKPEDFTVCEQLLFPVTLQLTHQEARLLDENTEVLTGLGFMIEHFGGESFLLRGVPAGIRNTGAKEIFLDLLDYFSQHRHTISGKALREKFLITMACKNAVKANLKMGLPEMESLLARLALAEQPYTCPHGRPTLLHFPGSDLEKRFKRVL